MEIPLIFDRKIKQNIHIEQKNKSSVFRILFLHNWVFRHLAEMYQSSLSNNNNCALCTGLLWLLCSFDVLILSLTLKSCNANPLLGTKRNQKSKFDNVFGSLKMHSRYLWILYQISKGPNVKRKTTTYLHTWLEKDVRMTNVLL